jgi:dTDP-4-dehydrorhamnose 3,5-epimerase
LLPESEVIYLVSEPYKPEADNGIIWNDSTINITWPIEPNVISEKDKNLLSLIEL